MTTTLVMLRPKRVMRARSRAHYSYPKVGCRCSRCVRMRRAEHLAEIIALYETRLTRFREELQELVK